MCLLGVSIDGIVYLASLQVMLVCVEGGGEEKNEEGGGVEKKGTCKEQNKLLLFSSAEGTSVAPETMQADRYRYRRVSFSFSLLRFSFFPLLPHMLLKHSCGDAWFQGNYAPAYFRYVFISWPCVFHR